jgi:hypothetical protein
MKIFAEATGIILDEIDQEMLVVVEIQALINGVRITLRDWYESEIVLGEFFIEIYEIPTVEKVMEEAKQYKEFGHLVPEEAVKECLRELIRSRDRH